MKTIYIRNTSFKIQNNKLIEEEQSPHVPETLYNSIPNFVSGEIFEVILKCYDGSFNSFQVEDLAENKNKNFLVNIVIKDIMINDKPEKILFFRDVTYGVLYEQIKASQKLSNIINETMNMKIGVPLTALVKTCESI